MLVGWSKWQTTYPITHNLLSTDSCVLGLLRHLMEMKKTWKQNNQSPMKMSTYQVTMISFKVSIVYLND